MIRHRTVFHTLFLLLFVLWHASHVVNGQIPCGDGSSAYVCRTELDGDETTVCSDQPSLIVLLPGVSAGPCVCDPLDTTIAPNLVVETYEFPTTLHETLFGITSGYCLPMYELNSVPAQIESAATYQAIEEHDNRQTFSFEIFDILLTSRELVEAMQDRLTNAELRFLLTSGFTGAFALGSMDDVQAFLGIFRIEANYGPLSFGFALSNGDWYLNMGDLVDCGDCDLCQDYKAQAVALFDCDFETVLDEECADALAIPPITEARSIYEALYIATYQEYDVDRRNLAKEVFSQYAANHIRNLRGTMGYRLEIFRERLKFLTSDWADTLRRTLVFEEVAEWFRIDEARDNKILAGLNDYQEVCDEVVRNITESCLLCIPPPTETPSDVPSISPSSTPTSVPTLVPSLQPSAMPTISSQPSLLPSDQPSNVPSFVPTTQPSLPPTSIPSSLPSVLQSMSPSQEPSDAPSLDPSGLPTFVGSSRPSAYPTPIPSSQPTIPRSIVPTPFPSLLPSTPPSLEPSPSPSLPPSFTPSGRPTIPRSIVPTPFPSELPSDQPTSRPSPSPTLSPSFTPTERPTIPRSIVPTPFPSELPSDQPTSRPSPSPTLSPSFTPTGTPTIPRSIVPTPFPSVLPSDQPTSRPSPSPTLSPSFTPTGTPTIPRSIMPTPYPSGAPSLTLSTAPSTPPSLLPSPSPSLAPVVSRSSVPSPFPSKLPTFVPSPSPTTVPTTTPSLVPSVRPSDRPTSLPRLRVGLLFEADCDFEQFFCDDDFNDIGDPLFTRGDTIQFCIVPTGNFSAVDVEEADIDQDKNGDGIFDVHFDLVTNFVPDSFTEIFCSLGRCRVRTILRDDFLTDKIPAPGVISGSFECLAPQTPFLVACSDSVESVTENSGFVSYPVEIILNDRGQSVIDSVEIEYLAGQGAEPRVQFSFLPESVNIVKRFGLNPRVYTLTLTGPTADLIACMASLEIAPGADNDEDISYSVTVTAINVEGQTRAFEDTCVVPIEEFDVEVVFSEAVGPEDILIPLDIAILFSGGDGDGSESVFLEIDTSSYPVGTTFYVGGSQVTLEVNGWLRIPEDANQISANEISGDVNALEILGPENFSGKFFLSARGTVIETTESGVETFSSDPANVPVTINPINDGLILPTNTSFGVEDVVITFGFGAVLASPSVGLVVIDDVGTQADGNNPERETITQLEFSIPGDLDGLQVTVLGAYAMETAGTIPGFGFTLVTFTPEDRSYLLTNTLLIGEDLAVLPYETRLRAELEIRATLATFYAEVTQAEHLDSDGSLGFIVDTVDVNNGLVSERTQIFPYNLVVLAVADTPGVVVQDPAGTVKENGPNLQLNIQPIRSPDMDESEVLTVQITIPSDGNGPVGVLEGHPPHGVQIEDLGNGVYLVSATGTSAEQEDLLNDFLDGNIYFNPRDNFSGEYLGAHGIRVDVISTEQRDDDKIADGAFGGVDGTSKTETVTAYIGFNVVPKYCQDSPGCY